MIQSEVIFNSGHQRSRQQPGKEVEKEYSRYQDKECDL
jgi:hypothetical protein